MTVEIHPADVYNQAFAWDHLLPARSFVIRTTPNAEFWKNWKKQQQMQKRQLQGAKAKSKKEAKP